MHVLISGAGVAGPTLAWFLARTGARVTIFEKAASLLAHGQNVDIQGSARTVVEKMGLTEEFTRNHTTERGTRLIDPKGQPIAPFPVGDGVHTASPTSPYEILRADVAKILWRATKDHPNVTYQFGTTVTRVLANNAAKVRVEASDGRVADYDLLVAADGQWSKVRKQCFSNNNDDGDDDVNNNEDEVKIVDLGVRVAYWTVPRRPEDDEWWNIYAALPAKLITTRPDPHGTTRAMLTCLPGTDAQKKEWLEVARQGREAQEALVRKEFAGAGWHAERLLAAMSQAPDFYLQLIQQVKMPRWYKNRVVCVGDAGYAPSPMTGMGTSMAISGAYVLAGELSRLREGEAPMRALEAYDEVYRPSVEEYQKVSPAFLHYVHPRTPFQRWIFQTALSTLSRVVAIPWVLKRLGSADQEDFKLPSYPALEGLQRG